MKLFLVGILLFSDYPQLAIFVFVSLLLDFLGFEIFLLLFKKFVILLFFVLQFFTQLSYLFFQLGDFRLESLLSIKINRKLCIKLLCQILEGDVWDQGGIFKRKIRVGRFTVGKEPMGDGFSLVSLSVRGDDRIVHLSFGDGAGPLLLEAFDEVMIFGVH